MENPLTSLDELIWKQFEKVTQYAHKSYGWDKYDLANMAESASGVGFVGTGTYAFLSIDHAFSFDQQVMLALAGTAALLLGPAMPYLSKKHYQFKREQEYQKLLQGQGIDPPHFSWWRPAFMYAGINVMAGGGGLLSREELICKIGGLAVLCSSIVYEGITLAHYFSSQLPTPPSAKKLFWKTTSEIMRNKFKPKPQLEPATGPAQQYTTIDTLIS